MTREELTTRATTAALMALVRHGVPTDVQGLLTTGDERGAVPPRALHAAVEAALSALSPVLKTAGEALGPMASVADEARAIKTVRDREEFCASVSWGYATLRSASSAHSLLKELTSDE
jgi:hypothetical protein